MFLTIDEDDLSKLIEQYVNEGPLVYELYSILIHSGSATGGHYFAFIKSFENKKWYNFNDSIVSEIKVQDIPSIYGGDLKSSTTAYILMYRLITNSQISHIDDCLINDELKNDINLEIMKQIENDKIEKEKANNITIKFKYNFKEKEINFKKFYTVKELKLKAMNDFEINIDEINVRLRVINYDNKFLETFPVEDLSLEETGIYSYKVYSLEVRENEKILFENYDPNGINIMLFLWENTFNEIDEKDFKYANFRINKHEKLAVLKENIYDIFKIDPKYSIFCFKKLEYSNPELFNSPSLLKKEICENAIYDNTKIYVEIKDNNWKSSSFLKVENE